MFPRKFEVFESLRECRLAYRDYRMNIHAAKDAPVLPIESLDVAEAVLAIRTLPAHHELRGLGWTHAVYVRYAEELPGRNPGDLWDWFLVR